MFSKFKFKVRKIRLYAPKQIKNQILLFLIGLVLLTLTISVIFDLNITKTYLIKRKEHKKCDTKGKKLP